MRMDIKLAGGTKVVLHYGKFKVASAKAKYRLTVEGFQGTTTDLYTMEGTSPQKK